MRVGNRARGPSSSARAAQRVVRGEGAFFDRFDAAGGLNGIGPFPWNARLEERRLFLRRVREEGRQIGWLLQTGE